jgi:hypothetical protein
LNAAWSDVCSGNEVWRRLTSNSPALNTRASGADDCELQTDREPGKLVPTVGRSIPTIGEFLKTVSAEDWRYPLIFQRLAFVLNAGMSDARGDG